MLVRPQHHSRWNIPHVSVEGSEHITVAIEQYRKGDVLRLRDFRAFEADGKKSRADGNEGLLRCDDSRHRIGKRLGEFRTEQKDDRVAGDGIGANIDDLSVDRGESAWRGNVASRQRWHI